MEKPEPVNRRLLIAGGLTAAVFPAAVCAQPLPFNLKGRFVQSGYAVGQADPGAQFWVDKVPRGKTSDKGFFFVGLDRDAATSCLIEVQNTTGGRDQVTIDVKPGTYDVQKVDGLPQQTVTPTDPDVLARIKRDSDLKNVAFASHDADDGFRTGFIYPLKDFRVSGHFGNQRVLNGVPKSPHYGFDMAAPAGTPIRAPALGLVVLAEPDMFYEGGLTLIDHGQGLISMYLHQSKVLVKKGDRVTQAQIIGHVGAKGRATGPHLCWRLKWGERRMDPSLMVG